MSAGELTVGSICTGYGGLDAVLALMLGAETIWTADNDSDVTKLLELRFGGVPNLGDIKTAEWPKIERPDIICAGFPCQDISPAGKRAGIRPGNRSGLWTWIAYIIGELRPSYVFIENSRSLTSAKAHSDVEPCPFCVGDGSRHPALRALGRVVGDLAAMGYDAQWGCVRASDVGAPHDRHRAFIWAWRRGADPDPRRAVRQARVEPGPSDGWPVHAGRPSDASNDDQRHVERVDADTGCGGVRRTSGDTASAPRPATSGIRTGIRPGGQRLRSDDRDARARLPATADTDGQTGEERDGWTVAGREAVPYRADAGRCGRADAGTADTDGVRGGSRRVAASGQTASRQSSGVSVGSGRTRDDADPDIERQRTDERNVHERQSDIAGHCVDDADPAEHRRFARGAERARVVGRSDAERDRSEVADTRRAGLAVGEVDDEPVALTAAERDHRNRLAGVAAADADSVRRDGWRRDAIRGAIRRTAARGSNAGDAPAGFVWRVGARDYTPAIKTWEAITGRAAPLPAVPNRRGDYRLNPRFSEWMMGLPDGWVTGVPGISRTAQLRIIGNGLVIAQGVLALALLLDGAGDG